MKKLLILMLLTPMVLMAKIPDEEYIQQKIADEESELYYPNLMLRFRSGDPSLTVEEMHYLYYGYAYQTEYRPLATNNSFDKVLLLASSLDADNPSQSMLDSIIIATNEALELNPFSPNLWNLLAYAYGALGDTVREKMAYDRTELILSVIDNSGSGLKERNPKHIIMFDHAIDLLTSQGISYLDAKVISRTVEYIPFTEALRDKNLDKKIKGLYFDYGRIYWNKPSHEDRPKRDRRWQINGI